MKQSKRILIVVALGAIMAGLAICCGALIALKGDFSRLSPMEFTTNTHVVESDFLYIEIDTADSDVRLARSEDDTCRVVCNEADKVYHTVELIGGILTIKQHDDRNWTEHIGIYWGDMSVTVYLPDDLYGSIEVKTASGDIRVSNIQVGGLLLETASGDVSCTGRQFKLLEVNTVSGEICLDDVVAETLRVKSTSGDVELVRCDGRQIQIETVTGEVEGSLKSGKHFETETVSGEVDVPKYYAGSMGTCRIKTVSGDIEIEVRS